VITDPIQPTYMDGGQNLVIGGPAGTKTVAVNSTGYFGAILATPPSEYIEPGAYTAQNGSGGANVGAFNWALTMPAYVVPTNIPTSINRSQDLTLNWTGGSSYSVVSILAFNGVLVTESPSLSSYVYIVCTANASSGTFTIPSAILNLLPSSGYGTVTQPGVNLSIAGIPEGRFTVSGSPGIDVGIFSVFASNGSVATIQR
jgi:hypothetical protein